MQTNLTRRAALSGAVASVALVGVAAAAAMPVANAFAGVSPDLIALMAAYDAAGLACREYGKNVVDPLETEAAAKAAALPHTTMTIECQEHSTSKSDSVNLAIVMNRSLSRGITLQEKRVFKPWRSFLAAHKRRERAQRQILRSPAIVAAGQHHDALSIAWADASYDVCHHPVSTAVDLHAKIAFMVKHDMGDGIDWTEQLLEDAARLAKMEG